MASLWKQVRSPYWFACFTGSDGRRVKKSTKQTDRKKAMAVCMQWSHAADLARQGSLTEAQARKVVSEIVERATGQPLAYHTLEEWLHTWLETKQRTKAWGTAKRYHYIVEDFIEFLGARAKLNISQITPKDLLRYRDEQMASGKTGKTCNTDLRVISGAFNTARRQGLILSNPVEAIESLRAVSAEKDTFTPAQISALVAAALPEWKGLILFAFYTGARLMDVATMRWECIDLPGQLIRFKPKKTGREVVVPLHPDLESHLRSIFSTRSGSPFLFPSLAVRAPKGSGGDHGMSATFKWIMIKAGIVNRVTRARGGPKGRTTNGFSFHSLRHSFNSAMANAGVAQEVRQKLTGHASIEMNNIYTHHEIEPLRTAIGLIPSLQAPTASK